MGSDMWSDMGSDRGADIGADMGAEAATGKLSSTVLRVNSFHGWNRTRPTAAASTATTATDAMTTFLRLRRAPVLGPAFGSVVDPVFISSFTASLLGFVRALAPAQPTRRGRINGQVMTEI